MMKQMKYYELHDDVYIPGRWHLKMPLYGEGGGEDDFFDVWQFKEGRVLDIKRPNRLTMKPAGRALEFSESLGCPVVHRRVVSLFERLRLQREVQFIPAEVEGQPEPWFILNALQVIRCIDDARSEEVFYWQPEDNRPEKLGGYKNVRGLKVDPAKIGGAHIFRPWGWKVVLIVSETSSKRWRPRASRASNSSRSDGAGAGHEAESHAGPDSARKVFQII